MAQEEVEAAWRAEFERIHEAEAFDGRQAVVDSAKVAVSWPGDEAEVRRLQEEHSHHYLRWTWFGAVAVMIVGVIGVSLSFLH